MARNIDSGRLSVMLWGQEIGQLCWNLAKGNSYFFFSPELKYDLRPSFGLRLLLTSPKFSAIAWSGSSFFILPNSLFSNVDL